ncbi:AraC family transcriptional regulator [Photobacterium sagamiensis]|uniref:AraC family transcriptional regulator n=1 Tax=Photobacterium sagamiensis TaxID=2910241 RepID=UPI003D0A216F
MEKEGFDLNDLFTESELDREALEAKPEMIPIKLYFCCVEKCLAATEIEHFGIICGEGFNLLSPGILSYVIHFSRDFIQALDNLLRYWPLEGPFKGKIHLGSEVSFELFDIPATSDVLKRFFAESMLLCLANLLSLNWSKKKLLKKVCFKFDASHNAATYEKAFQCPVEFNQTSNQLFFRDSALKLVQTHYNPELYKVVEKQCVQQLSLLKTKENTTGNIYKILFKYSGELPNLEQIASMFGTSSATLKRWLVEENTTYREIVTSYRIEQTSRLLTETDIAIQGIASIAGYKSPTNFSRAFTNRMHVSPSQYRKQYKVDKKNKA